VLLLPIGVMPMVFGMSGMVSMVIVSLANLVMVWQCIRLFREMDVKAARRVMFTSYIYLPVVLLALLADKQPVPGCLLQPVQDQTSVRIENTIFLNKIHFTDRKS
jgi:heme O synthase-like polyprenyltransferase